MKETWRNCEKSFVIFFFTPLSRLPNAHRFRACILISSTSNVNRVSSIFIRRISILKSMGWDDFKVGLSKSIAFESETGGFSITVALRKRVHIFHLERSENDSNAIFFIFCIFPFRISRLHERSLLDVNFNLYPFNVRLKKYRA